MRSILLLFFLFLFSFTNAQEKKEKNLHEHNNAISNEGAPIDTLKKSIPKVEHAQIGNAHLMITYHAPAVRGRTIWGGLVPYDEVWVTGAHSATTFEIDKSFLWNGNEIAQGKYALFTIPGKDKWTIILNKNWEQHLTDEYDAKDDIIRIVVMTKQAENVQERLKYSILPNGETKGTITIRWEKISVSIPIEIK